MVGNAQMNSGSEIGIDEQLGETVALDIPLKDENGGDIKLGQLVDKPTILIFNYFRCPGIFLAPRNASTAAPTARSIAFPAASSAMLPRVLTERPKGVSPAPAMRTSHIGAGERGGR